MIENTVVIIDGVRKVNDFGSQIVVSNVNEASVFQNKLSSIYCLTDLEHYQEVVNTARECPEGSLTVVIQIEYEKGIKGAILLDANSNDMYTRRHRKIADPRNLRVDTSGYFKLKEVSKRIKSY
jgi:hypothetical protein